MSQIIDRRPNGNNKSALNRQRFYRRIKSQIRQSLNDSMNKRSITNVSDGESVSIASTSIKEPIFKYSKGGINKIILAGNKNFVKGDTINRLENKKTNSTESSASNTGEGEDNFTFNISNEEFLDVFFDDLELPNLLQRRINNLIAPTKIRQGYTKFGTPANINIVRSIKGAIARRIATKGMYKSQSKKYTQLFNILHQLKENILNQNKIQNKNKNFTNTSNDIRAKQYYELIIKIIKSLKFDSNINSLILAILEKESDKINLDKTEISYKENTLDKLDKILELLQNKIKEINIKTNIIPFIDPLDLKYNNKIIQHQPATQAVMFCLMDVSGSMDEAKKEIAKKFFILLYLFLNKNYKTIEVIFIRHHTSAKEVDEKEFFYSRETGGTVVSSALDLMQNIISQKYPIDEWNIYAAQASDGDNWNNDSPRCRDILINNILPFVQHYSYIEIIPRQHQSLWESYSEIKKVCPYFAMETIKNANEVCSTFRNLFKKNNVATSITA